jgi:hypothetical protein
MRIRLHIVALLAVLAFAALSPAGVMATSSRSGPLAHTACRHFGEKEPRSPCRVGNILFSCGYALGACEYSKYLKCKVSRLEGTVVKFVQEPKEGIEGQRIENQHKTVTCKGTATILKVYLVKGPEAPYTYKLVTTPAHSFTVTLYPNTHDRPDELVVMAQH